MYKDLLSWFGDLPLEAYLFGAVLLIVPVVNFCEKGTFGVRGWLTTLAGFILGVGLTVFLWYRIFPPSGPGYGDGMSWGLALTFWSFIGGFLGAILGALLGVITGNKPQPNKKLRRLGKP